MSISRFGKARCNKCFQSQLEFKCCCVSTSFSVFHWCTLFRTYTNPDLIPKPPSNFRDPALIIKT